jgi:hypothetical protein
MPSNDDAVNDADANNWGEGGADVVGEPGGKKKAIVGEGSRMTEGAIEDASSREVPRAEAEDEGEGTTTSAAAHADVAEGGGGNDASSIAATSAATAKDDHQDQRRQQQREEIGGGDEDDDVTATWSLDSDGRPVSMPHSWHPAPSFGSYARGGGGGEGIVVGGGGGEVGGRGGGGATTMMPGAGTPPPGGVHSHSRRGAHASSSHHNFRPVRSAVSDDRHRGQHQQQPAPAPISQYHGGVYHRQDQQHLPQQYAALEDYRYHGGGGHRSGSSAAAVPPQQSIRHCPPPPGPHPQEHGRYPSHVGVVGRGAPMPQFVDRRPPPHDQQQPQHRDYRPDHPSGGGGGGIRGAGGGGLYYPQDDQQQPYHHVRRADVYHRSPTESSYPPSNQSSIHHPPVPHRPSTHQVATTPSSSSQLQMLPMQHHPPYHPQMVSMNVGNVMGGGDGGNNGNTTTNNPLLSTRQRNPSQKGCSCRKTRCLKLYCQCFAASVLCSAHQCICDGCQNNEGEAIKGNRGAIAIARRQVLVRNPNAFENKFLENNPVVPSSGSIANAVAPDAAANASMGLIYRPPPRRHNGSVDSGRLTGYTQVGYGGVVGRNDVQQGGSADYDVPVHQEQQHLGRLLPPPPPRTGLPHHEFQFRSLDSPSTSSLRQEDAVVDETLEKIKATMGCEDQEAREPSEGGLKGDDAGAVAVETSTSTKTTKIDEEKKLDDKGGEEKSSSSKGDTTKSSQASRSRIVQEMDDVEMDDPQDDRPEIESKIDSQIIDTKIVVEIEREVEQEEREQPENDNIMGASSSSISTSKSLEPSSTSSFSKPSFEMSNSRSWEVDRRQRGGSYNNEYEGRHAVIDHYYNQHMRGLGYNEDSYRGFDPLSHRGHAMGSGTPGGNIHYPSSGLGPFPTLARQYPGGRAPAHHVVLSHQLPAARINMEGERGHTNMDVQQMQGSIPSKVHRVGCKCKKSKCLKKYCECFSNGIKCASHCKCENCGNQPTDNLSGNPQGSSIQNSVAVNVTLSSDNSIELSPGRTLHIVSSEEDKASITQRPTSMPSLDATLDDDQYSKEGSSKYQEIKKNPTTAVAETPRRTSDNDMKLDFLATLATSALDTLNADAKDAAKKRQISREEDWLTMDGNENERMDQQEASLKRHRSSSDGMDPRKRYMSEQQEQQRHHYEQNVHQYQAPQAYHDQYVRHHRQYEERGGHSAYHQQSSHHHQQHHHWPGVQHQLDSRSFAPRGQHGHSQGAPHPQAIRPQFSRYQPPQHQNPVSKYTTMPTSETAAHVPDNISTALATAQLKNRLPKGLTYRKVCSHCGRQRAEHGEFGFGNKCPFTTCGRCGADQEQHRKNSGTCTMGVYCTLTEEDGAKKGASDKYDAVLADLAARAEVRACMTIALERC